MSNTGWPCSRASAHRRRHAANSQSRRRNRGTSAPLTPVLRWNANAAPSSSRQLAAGLWHLRFTADSFLSGETADRLSPQPDSASLNPNCVKEKSTKRSIASELAQAKTRVRELEAEKRSLRKRLKCLSENLAGELAGERKIRRRAEILNAVLVKQLSEVNSSRERMAREYEEEKESREFAEEVCERLVQQIGEDKARSERVWRELEEERRMLQIAEVWREERVHMKLADSRLALEARFSEMNSLVAELEALLGSETTSGAGDGLRKARRILRAAAAESQRVQDVVEELDRVDTASEVSAVASKHNVSPVSMTRSHRRFDGDIKTTWTKPESREDWSENPHVVRGMKGRVEWPRAAPKSGRKAEISEAVVENQKSRLRHGLRPKTFV